MLTLAGAGVMSANRLIADYFGVFLVAFFFSFMASPLLRWLAMKNGIVDQPDRHRKNHLEPVAYLGGIALYLGWVGGVLLSHFLGPDYLEKGQFESMLGGGFPLPIIFGATVIMLTGLIDDVYGISPRVKIGGQFMAAAALALSSQNLGVKLVTDTLAGFDVHDVPGFVSYSLGGALIALFVVGGCNSMNLLDGLDGLATGVSAVVYVGFLFIAVTFGVGLEDPAGSRVLLVMCLAVLGAVLGFLPYNFNPAHIFMGDAGSLLLGYLSVSTILLFADAPRRGPVLVAAGLIVYALPITDMLMTICRRTLKGQRLSAADKEHLHHRVLAAIRQFVPSSNLSTRLAVLVMYGLAVIFAGLGYALVFVSWRYVLAVFLAVFGFIAVGAYKSGRRQAFLERARDLPDDAAPADPRDLVETGEPNGRKKHEGR